MIGLVVNPIAGIGGPAGLSGSDGTDVQRAADALGGRSRAYERTVVALRELAGQASGTVVATAAGDMGEAAVVAAGLTPQVVYWPASPTTALDTTAAVESLARAGSSLVLFSGGDGTARDVAATLPDGLAALGIPCGVKMYSPVFAVGPRAAGAIAARWLVGGMPTVRRDVLDVDEAELRQRRARPRLVGSVSVPVDSRRTQARKSTSNIGEHSAVLAAARGFVASMRPGLAYILGPGGTMQEVARLIGYDKAPLGVDVVRDGELLLRNASEADLSVLDVDQSQVVVSVIGGQGFVFGRGNQQLSAKILHSLGPQRLTVVATEQKLIDLGGRPLLVDTGDPAVDLEFSGVAQVITGENTKSLYRVRAADMEVE